MSYIENLVKNTARNLNMQEVSADKGYSSEKNLQIVTKHGAVPFIVFKKSAKISDDKMLIWRIILRYFKNHKEDFMKHYHKRSNVESVFSMMKQKFGS